MLKKWIEKKRAKQQEQQAQECVEQIRHNFAQLVQMGARSQAFEEITSIIATQSTPKERREITHWLMDLNFHFEHVAGQAQTSKE